jgi:peptidyl-prolyl cis-trans isomerase B (cyclophilin B)
MTIQAIITMEHGDRIVLDLDPTQAPQTVANFVKLAGEHFYDGLTFHRVIPGFMIQGGCPQGTGTGGPGYQIKGEFAKNGINNTISHDRGVISMARSASPDSAGSQFFIMHQKSPHLDGQYAAFGRVSSGLDIVDQIANTPTGRQDRPITEQKIRSIIIEKSSEEQ